MAIKFKINDIVVLANLPRLTRGMVSVNSDIANPVIARVGLIVTNIELSSLTRRHTLMADLEKHCLNYVRRLV